MAVGRIKIETEIVLDIDVAGKWFAGLNDDGQSKFFVAVAGNGPVGGHAKAAKDAESHWYNVTLPMLYELNAVYSYQSPNLDASLVDARKHLRAYLPDPPRLELSSQKNILASDSLSKVEK